MGGNNSRLLRALVPRKKTLSAVPKPTLYWCVSDIPTKSMEMKIGLREYNSLKPVLIRSLPEPQYAGIHPFSVDIALKPEVGYEWAVWFTKDTSDKSNPVFLYRPLSEELSKKLEQAKQVDPSKLPSIYAENGYWYDAVAALYQQAQAGRCDSKDSKLRDQWRDLLKQQGLELPPACGPCIKR